jgi:hypothetical protein
VLFARIVGVLAAEDAAFVELQLGNDMVYCGSCGGIGGLCHEWDSEDITGGAVVYELQISNVVEAAWQAPVGAGADDFKCGQCCLNYCGEWCSSLFAVCTSLIAVMKKCLECIELGLVSG